MAAFKGGGGCRRALASLEFILAFISIKYCIMLHALLYIRNYSTS